MPAVDTYNLIAWNAHLQAAIAAGDDRQVAPAGAPYLQRGLTDDPSNPQLRVALVRYDLMFSRVQAAADELRTGLRSSPTNPLLQGLLGYLAQALAGQASPARSGHPAHRRACRAARQGRRRLVLAECRPVGARPARGRAPPRSARRADWPRSSHASDYKQRILGQS